MPLLPEPTTEELEDHFFGSGAFSFGWFRLKPLDWKFPATVLEMEDGEVLALQIFTTELFIKGIKKYAESLPDRTYQDLLEDMDAGDVDNCIQLAMFGEIRYS